MRPPTAGCCTSPRGNNVSLLLWIDQTSSNRPRRACVCECVPGNGRAHMYGVPFFVSAPGGADDGAFCAECRAETQRMKTLLLLLLLGEEEVEKEVEEEGEAVEEG